MVLIGGDVPREMSGSQQSSSADEPVICQLEGYRKGFARFVPEVAVSKRGAMERSDRTSRQCFVVTVRAHGAILDETNARIRSPQRGRSARASLPRSALFDPSVAQDELGDRAWLSPTWTGSAQESENSDMYGRPYTSACLVSKFGQLCYLVLETSVQRAGLCSE